MHFRWPYSGAWQNSIEYCQPVKRTESMVLLLLTFLFSLQFKIEDTNLDVCPEGSLKLEYFKVGRIVPGQKLTIQGKGDFTKRVTSGKVHTQVLFGIIPIVNRQDDLCSAVGEIDLHCPLDGKQNIQKEFDIPKEIPPGNYVLRVDAIDQDNGKVTCISGKITVEHG